MGLLHVTHDTYTGTGNAGIGIPPSTPGTTLIVFAEQDGGVSEFPIGISDDAPAPPPNGTDWVKIADAIPSGHGGMVAWYLADNSGGINVLTFRRAQLQGGSWATVCYEWEGLGVLDKVALGTATEGTVGPTGTTTQADEVAFAAIGSASGVYAPPAISDLDPDTWTTDAYQQAQQTLKHGVAILVGHQVLTSQQAVSASATVSGGAGPACIIATFRA